MLTIYDKARAMGLDERQIRLAQQDFVPSMPVQHVAIHEAHDRVLILAKAYDNPHDNVTLPTIGKGIGLVRSLTDRETENHG